MCTRNSQQCQRAVVLLNRRVTGERDQDEEQERGREGERRGGTSPPEWNMNFAHCVVAIARNADDIVDENCSRVRMLNDSFSGNDTGQVIISFCEHFEFHVHFNRNNRTALNSLMEAFCFCSLVFHLLRAQVAAMHCGTRSHCFLYRFHENERYVCIR